MLFFIRYFTLFPFPGRKKRTFSCYYTLCRHQDFQDFRVVSRCKKLDSFLTLFQTSLGFYGSAVQVFLKTLREKEKLLVTSNFSFFPVFSTYLENFLPFSSKLELSSAKSFSLEESKICRLGKG